MTTDQESQRYEELKAWARQQLQDGELTPEELESAAGDFARWIWTNHSSITAAQLEQDAALAERFMAAEARILQARLDQLQRAKQPD